MFYMANKLGSWQVDGDATGGRVRFQIFFPRKFDPGIEAIRVAGTFQHLFPGGKDWDFLGGCLMESDDSRPEGTFWHYTTPDKLPAGYYQYKYLVQFKDGGARHVSDPCARYGGTDNQNAAVVVGGSRPEENVVKPLKNGRKSLEDLIIYEMNLDDFTDEYREARAPLDAVVDRLDYLGALGFNAILFMPWTAWKNRDFDWGYEPFQYFAVEYRLANDLNQPTEKISWLKKLVSACHERDIHVIMDGVFNHASMDFPYEHLYCIPEMCPYTGKFGGEFPGLRDLDFENQCTQEFVRDVCVYWIETFGIDGIRLDNTVNFNVPGDTKGLTKLLEEVHGYAQAKGLVHFSLTLEHLSLDAADLTNKTKATSYWDNALYGLCFRNLWHGGVQPALLNALNNRRYLKDPDKIPTSYIGNHDHSHVTWQAGARDNEGAMKWYKTQPYVIALYTGRSTPMVQNGQEFGEDHWIPEDDRGTGRRVVPRPLRWKCVKDSIGESLLKLYARMGEIRRKHAVFRTGSFDPDYWEEWQEQFNPAGLGVDTSRQMLIYRRSGQNEIGLRQEAVIVLNFSDFTQRVVVPFPEDGVWTDLLSGYAGTWQPLISGNRLDFEVGAHWGHVFFRQWE